MLCAQLNVAILCQRERNICGCWMRGRDHAGFVPLSISRSDNSSLLPFFPLNGFSFHPWILELSSVINVYVDNTVLSNRRKHEWQKNIKLIFISFFLCFSLFHYISSSNTAHFQYSCFCSPCPWSSNFVLVSILYPFLIYFSSPFFNSLSRALSDDNNFVTEQVSAEVTLSVCIWKVFFLYQSRHHLT
jgi:hypothetical protein